MSFIFAILFIIGLLAFGAQLIGNIMEGSGCFGVIFIIFFAIIVLQSCAAM